MKAVSFDRHGGLEVLRYGDVAEPEPAAGEVLLEVKAAALNFNDVWGRRGLPRVRIPLPHVSGSDAAGVVVARGPGVSGVDIGDEVIVYPVNACRRCPACLSGEEVFCREMRIWGFQTGPLDGSYAEYAKVQAEQVLPKPRHLSWTDAAATTTSLLSVWRMLVTRARTKAGDRVLIWGASGGTGAYAIALARALGAVPIAVTSSREKAAFCERMGAEHVIVPPGWGTAGADEHVTREVHAIAPRGVDIVFDHVGETTWPVSVECLRWGGTIVICGATEGFQPRIDLRYLWNKQLSFLGSHIGTRREWVDAMCLVEQRRIAPPVTRVFPLAELARAQGLMEDRALTGKIAVTVSG